MKRRLFNIATAVSLVLCVGTTALWIRSHWRHDVLYQETSPYAWFVISNYGGLTIGFREQTGYYPRSTWRFSSYEAFPGPFGVLQWSFAGFVRSSVQFQNSPAIRDDYWTFPHWFAVFVACIAPGIWSIRMMRERARDARRKTNRCPTCGYDLRATPDRCPECGSRPGGFSADLDGPDGPDDGHFAPARLS